MSTTNKNVVVGGYNTINRFYGRRLWGSPSMGFRDTKVVIRFGISALAYTTINLVARYKITEPTIEDVYSYATDRFMRMKCLDGTLFPFFSKDGESK